MPSFAFGKLMQIHLSANTANTKGPHAAVTAVVGGVWVGVLVCMRVMMVWECGVVMCGGVETPKEVCMGG